MFISSLSHLKIWSGPKLHSCQEATLKNAVVQLSIYSCIYCAYVLHIWSACTAPSHLECTPRGHATIEPKPFGSDLGTHSACTHSACTQHHGMLPDAPPDLQLPQPLQLPSPSLIPRFHHHYICFHHPLHIHIILGHSPTIPVSPLHPQHISGCTSPCITIPCISTPF